MVSVTDATVEVLLLHPTTTTLRSPAACAAVNVVLTVVWGDCGVAELPCTYEIEAAGLTFAITPLKSRARRPSGWVTAMAAKPLARANVAMTVVLPGAKANAKPPLPIVATEGVVAVQVT